MYAMKLSDISHAVGVVSRYMENPVKEVKWVFFYLWGMCITYSGCNVLAYDYVDSKIAGDFDKRRSTSGYFSHECKDL